jgi:hypothetical protein
MLFGGAIVLRKKEWSTMATGDLKNMTKAELMKMARAMKLDIKNTALKAEIIAKIKKASPGKKKASRAEAKPKTKKKAAVKGSRKKAAASRRALAGKKAKPKTRPPKAAQPRVAGRREAAPEQRPSIRQEPAARERRLEAETIRQKAEAGKYYLGAEEKAMPPVESLDIPAGYGTDRIVAMVRDPHWIFTYWEVTVGSLKGLEKKFGNEWRSCRMILRVFDLTEASGAHFDVPVGPDARNWYINASPNKRYQVAIGILSPDGRFAEIVRSNTIETPRANVSDVVDDRWMIPEELFDLIFAASGGRDIHAASVELRELLEHRLLEEVGSGAVSSFGSGELREMAKQRGFRLWIDTELILYGATEPDARLTVQGKEVKLRSDGTFTMRFALPDGAIDLPVTAVSADAVEERTIETKVDRKSKRKGPVIR